MTDEVMHFAEKIGGYIGCSFMGLSAIPNDCERFLGMQGMHGHFASSMANKRADLIIGIGIRFSDRATGNTEKYAKNTTVIQLDVDQSEINKNIIVDVGVKGDIKDSLQRITEAVEKKARTQWDEIIAELRQQETKIEDARRITTSRRNTINPPPASLRREIGRAHV